MLLFCPVLLLLIEPPAESRPSQPRTKLVWTKSTYRSWQSWEKHQCHHLAEGTTAPREEVLGPQDPTTTSLLR